MVGKCALDSELLCTLVKEIRVANGLTTNSA